MLVLSRRERQTIRIGDDIVVSIVKIGGDIVRVGIDAPRHVPIVRDDANPLRVADDCELVRAARKERV